MAVDVSDLAKHLGFAATPADTETLERALGTASAVIAPHLMTADAPPTPAQVHALDQATLIVGGTVWRAKDAVGGSYVFADGTDQVGVLPRDLLRPVLPLLIEAGLAAALTV